MRMGVLAAHQAAAAVQAFTYDDIPNQLLRIDYTSMTGSGGTLTGLTDASSAGETINVSGTPTYTASDANLNGQPSFQGATVDVPNIDLSLIVFVAIVVYNDGSGNLWLFDGNDATDRATTILNTSGTLTSLTQVVGSIAGESSVGRKRIIVPHDGTSQVLWNGSESGTVPDPALTGTGAKVGTNYTDAGDNDGLGFLMLCSSVPTADQIAQLEAQLRLDYGDQLPLPTTNLLFGNEADVGVTHTSNNVTLWADQGPLGNDGSSPTAGREPLLTTDATLGDVIYFDTAAGDYMDWVGASNTSNNFTVCYVMNLLNTSGSKMLFYCTGGAGGATIFGYDGGTGDYSVNDGATTQFFGGTLAAGVQVLTFVVTGTNVDFYLDRTFIGNVTVNALKEVDGNVAFGSPFVTSRTPDANLRAHYVYYEAKDAAGRAELWDYIASRHPGSTV